jgi:hypothetical protein
MLNNVPWLRKLVVSLSRRRSGFAPGPVHVGNVLRHKLSFYTQLCKSTCLHLAAIYKQRIVQSTCHEKIPARNYIYAHEQDFAMSDDLLLAILKAFVPQVNKQWAFICLRTVDIFKSPVIQSRVAFSNFSAGVPLYVI